MTASEWLMILTLSIIWGGAFFCSEVAVRELPFFTIVACRVGLAAIILFAITRLRGIKMPTSPAIWGAFFLMGLLNNAIPFSLIVWGQSHIASGLASILNATTPLFSVIVAHFFTQDERITPARLGGVVVGFLGVTLMIGGDVLDQIGVDIAAQLGCLGAALSYSIAGVFGRRFWRMGISPLATATGQITAASCMLIPIALVINQPWTLPVPSMGAILSVLGLAALCTALAYILYFRVLATAGATNLMLVTFLVPVTAIFLGILFLGETLEIRHIAGMVMIGLGLVAIDGRLLKKQKG
ncbi:MAG: DMT family transporter [Alphaproteobacteria bacterium]|nr:DMT family transporter [Alphaproteobacteria bacterium]